MTNREKSRKATTLLHLSGGQDSVYVAWKWLTEHPNEVLFLHHINLYHSAENRLDHERKAVQSVLEWFLDNGIENWVYYESTFSYGNLPRISIKDIQICTVFTAIIAKTQQFSNVKTLLLSWHKGEVDRVDINRGFRVKAMLKAFEIDWLKIEFPIIDHTRKQMADEMPKELLERVHFCRSPLKNRNCGVCKTCREYKEAGIFKEGHFCDPH